MPTRRDPQLPLWLYDGDCGPCEQGSQRIAATVGPPVQMASVQSVDLDALGVSPADTERGPVLVQPDGSHLVGTAAMAAMLALSPRPYCAVGRVMAAPGLRTVLNAVGVRLYQQRWRLPGAGAACAAPSHAA